MSTTYLQLQSSASTIVSTNGVVLFNETMVAPDEQNISYDSTTGLFHFHTAGVYYVSWSVAADSAANAEFSLVTSSNKYYRADSAQTPDELSGSAIVTIDLPDTTLSLRNTSTGSAQLGNADIVANIVIHSIELTNSGPATAGTGSVINFNSGGIDITNPLTYPILLQVLQISLMQNEVGRLEDTFTCMGLEELFGLPGGILGIVGGGIVEVVLTPCRLALGALLAPLRDIFDQTSSTTNTGLFSMDSYIGHSNVGVVPALGGSDIPILSLIAGPPYPQIIAREGLITAFAAEIDILAALDISIFNIIGGIFSTIVNLFLEVVSAVAVLIETLINLAGELLGFHVTLPGDFADILNNKIFNLWRVGTPDTNHHVHAILWKGSQTDGNALGGDVTWEQVSDLDLGPIPFAELSLVDTFLSGLGDVIEAGEDLATALVTLLGARGEENLSPTNLPFVDAKTSGLSHPISVGDYLMVQFTLIGEDNTTILAGVLATELMASVTISCDENANPQES